MPSYNRTNTCKFQLLNTAILNGVQCSLTSNYNYYVKHHWGYLFKTAKTITCIFNNASTAIMNTNLLHRFIVFCQKAFFLIKSVVFFH